MKTFVLILIASFLALSPLMAEAQPAKPGSTAKSLPPTVKAKTGAPASEVLLVVKHHRHHRHHHRRHHRRVIRLRLVHHVRVRHHRKVAFNQPSREVRFAAKTI